MQLQYVVGNMPSLSLLLHQRQQTRLQLAQLEDATIHLAATLIQGCFLIHWARRRLRVERSLRIINSASSRTLRRWLNVGSAPLFKNPTISSMLYTDYRELLHRRDICHVFSLKSLELCIMSLSERIATDHYQSATKVQRRYRGTRGRARYKKLRDDQRQNHCLRHENATKIQQRIRGFQERQRYREKLLKIFEHKQLQNYQEERRIDEERRERAEMRAKMMKLYSHERHLDESRRLFGRVYAQKGANIKVDGQPDNNDDDTDELAVTLTSCSKAYLAGASDPVPTRRCHGGSGLSRDERSRLVWAYNRKRWNRRAPAHHY